MLSFEDIILTLTLEHSMDS